MTACSFQDSLNSCDYKTFSVPVFCHKCNINIAYGFSLMPGILRSQTESMAADSKTLYIRDCQLEESMKKSKIAALGTVWIPVLRGFSEGVISEETAAWIFRYNQIQVSRSFGSDAHVPACINIATSSILMWLSVLTNTSCWFKDTPIH